MDPLSVASRVTGLLSFASGLAKLSVKLKHAVDQFKSAPSQIEELGQKLGILETVCYLVDSILRKRQLQMSNLGPDAGQDTTLAISAALTQCYLKMEALERTLATVRVISDLTGPMKETRSRI